MTNTTDINILKYEQIASPKEIKSNLQISEELSKLVQNQRNEIQNIIHNKSNKKIFIIGPCSIHNPKSAIEYAKKLKELSSKVEDKIIILMRAYFEKPRTITGWRGLISDPHLNNTFDAETGYKTARKLILDILELGLPVATELLDPITPQYIDDGIAWAAIGARTIESPPHRLMVSGLSTPTGFKNAISGNISAAINAVQAASHPGNFIGINQDGHISNIKTKGNTNSHIILRGGSNGPNYEQNYIKETEEKLKKNNLEKSIIIDCSHQNSKKDYTKQKDVLYNCIDQIKNGNTSIKGFMLESNLKEGNQKIPNDLTNFDESTLTYGVSITDACIGWDETEQIILDAYKKL